MTNYDQSMMPTETSVITTYRCQMRCQMCEIWKNPSKRGTEIQPKTLELLPKLKFINITGGEPFLRHDLEDIIEVAFSKAPRVVISTSGWHIERIVALAAKYPKIGIRVSIEGLSQKNDELRGRAGGFDRGLKTLLLLKSMGINDIGFGITVSNMNSEDMLHLYSLAKSLKLEFATAAFHNSFYFHKYDNLISNKDEVIRNFHKLIEMLLKENSAKSWFRAFFNLGLINFIRNGKRMLPCEAGTTNFFVDPSGEIYPCNGLEDRYWKVSIGNLNNASCFEDIWFGEQANQVRKLVRKCPKNCWMVGTAAPVMKKYIKHPAKWVIKNKISSLLHKPICVDEVPIYSVGQDIQQGDLRATAECNYVLESSEDMANK